MSSWKYFNPVEVHFGSGCRANLLPLVKNKNILLVVSKGGKRRFDDDQILFELSAVSNVWVCDTVEVNPTIECIEEAVEKYKSFHFDFIVAFGGGSSLDVAKVLSVSLINSTIFQKFIDFIAYDSLESLTTIPLIAIPTTAGTGSEVTPFATIWDQHNKRKLSLSGKNIFPDLALIDPELTLGLPEEVMISSGLDAINQAIESIWNKNANSMTLDISIKSLQLSLDSLPQLYRNNNDLNAREKMSEASLLAGLAISQTRTALCHSISYPLTAHYHVPHGLACAFTMPAVLRRSLLINDGRFTTLVKRLCGSSNVNDLIDLFDALNADLNVKERVKKYINSYDDISALRSEMCTPGRADNCIVATSEIDAILKESWFMI